MSFPQSRLLRIFVRFLCFLLVRDAFVEVGNLLSGLIYLPFQVPGAFLC